MSTSQTNSSNGQEKYLSTSEGGITPASVIAVGAVLSGLAVIAVALRFYVRLIRVYSSLGIEDWLILVSVVLTLGMGLMMIIGSAMGGLARPTPQGTGSKGYLTATDDAEILTEKIFWAFDLVQCFAFGTAKLSVLFFYRRIFRGDVFRIISMTMIVTVVIWTLAFFFAILFRCGTQFWALWAPLKFLLANCYASTPMFQAFSISDVITDVLILAMPIYWTSRLHMTFSKKLAVCGVFLLGAVVIAAGAARLAIFVKQTNNPYQNADGIGHLTTEIYWSMIEMGISVVAACLPAIWPLISKISLESMVHTVRSMFSLESIAQSASSRSRRQMSTNERNDNERGSGPYERFSGGSDKTSTKDPKIDMIPMRDIEAQ
ncbi:uncharacterized protein F4822DRAFT_435250 [Hypoxylon trugodes]|uniref:uncharacterized protein n=1 Tax=Hypoxylon trugodes TaxID=326681 RepID=UPI0021A0D9EE|nr:uncharacterized protein F4822DRAFT_435250 [Hypoxylon trugodes]KAI1382875.1 hypothetical protein F4822DRAFT_435250 [Hypoxylon trugodes]